MIYSLFRRLSLILCIILSNSNIAQAAHPCEIDMDEYINPRDESMDPVTDSIPVDPEGDRIRRRNECMDYFENKPQTPSEIQLDIKTPKDGAYFNKANQKIKISGAALIKYKVSSMVANRRPVDLFISVNKKRVKEFKSAQGKFEYYFTPKSTGKQITEIDAVEINRSNRDFKRRKKTITVIVKSPPSTEILGKVEKTSNETGKISFTTIDDPLYRITRNNGIKSIEYFVNGVPGNEPELRNPDNRYKWDWDTGSINLQRGHNKIRVKAKDHYGNIGKDDFTIPFGEKILTVEPDTSKNSPEVIRFKTTDNEKNFKIDVTANDPFSSITMIQLFDSKDGSLVAQKTGSPLAKELKNYIWSHNLNFRCKDEKKYNVVITNSKNEKTEKAIYLDIRGHDCDE
ncbi:MAG: hypothetical protein R3E95_10330 [Thiolinea sp.]